MARTFAHVKTAIWGEDHFRELTGDAQLLYFMLKTAPVLSYCGVTDWRPSRIAANNADWTAERVVSAGLELHQELFIVVDEATEEVMIRTFVKHDGFMESPNIAAAMVREYASIASKHLRAVLVHELVRLHDSEPELKGWKKASVLLSNPSVNPSTNPSGWGSGNPSEVVTETLQETPRVTPPSLPLPLPSPSSLSPSVPRVPRNNGKGTRIPEPFTVDEAMKDWARERNMQPQWVMRQTERFINYWSAAAGAKGVKTDWRATWRNWLLKAQDDSPAAASPVSRNGYAPDDVRARFQ